MAHRVHEPEGKDKASKSTTSGLMPENPQNLTPQRWQRKLRVLRTRCSRPKSLEFERAAAIRDSLAELQSLAFK